MGQDDYDSSAMNVFSITQDNKNTIVNSCLIEQKIVSQNQSTFEESNYETIDENQSSSVLAESIQKVEGTLTELNSGTYEVVSNLTELSLLVKGEKESNDVAIRRNDSPILANKEKVVIEVYPSPLKQDVVFQDESTSESSEKSNNEKTDKNKKISVLTKSIQKVEGDLTELNSETDKVISKLPLEFGKESNVAENIRSHESPDKIVRNGTGLPMEYIEIKSDSDVSTMKINSITVKPDTDLTTIPPAPNSSYDGSLTTTPHLTEFEIEKLLTTIGEFGTFQKVLNTILFIMCLPSVYQVLIMYFSTLTPPWRCVENSTECKSNSTHNPDDHARCTMNRTEWYYTEHKGYSLVTQFDLHCDEKWKLNLVSSILFLGWGIGSIMCGSLGDRYGRRSVFLPSVGFALMFGFLTTFCSNIYQISTCQFAIGLFIPGIQLQAFILISEFVSGKKRALAGILIILTDPVAWCILAVKAYFTQNWKTLSMVATLPYIFVFLFYKFIPESIRWLHFNGKTDRVRETVLQVAKWNKKELPEHFKVVGISDRNEDRESYKVNKTSPLDLFRKKRDAMLSIVQAFLWLVTACSYFGLYMAADDLGGNIYRDFIILNLVELPAVFVAITGCNKIGRKITSLLPLFCGSIACVILAFLPSVGVYRIARIVLGVAGKFCSSITFNALYTWSSEIYDLPVRSKGMGWLLLVSRIGSAGAPWIVKGLKSFSSWLPFFALGCPALLGSIVSIWLPETNTCKKKDIMPPLHDYIAKNEHTV